MTESTNLLLQSTAASETSDSSQETLERHISSLNQVLFNFSDAAQFCRSGRMDLWRRRAEKPSMAEISKFYAPVGMEKQFQELYRMLHPCLVQRDGKTNSSAFLQGTRGSGKTLLLNQCLQAVQDELSISTEIPPFRLVKLNGIISGDNVGLVVKDILRQLTVAAYRETERADPVNDDDDSRNNNADSKRTKSSDSERTSKLLRLRQGSFTNNLQLLNEILKLACIDGIPVLFILDELDAFLGATSSSSQQQEDSTSSMMEENTGNARQVLLYNLLDRVSTQGSFICFVGISSHLGILTMLEKRIRSRAEGTSRFIMFGPCPTFKVLVSVLLSKFVQDETSSANDDEPTLHQQVSKLLSPPLNDSDPIHTRVYDTLKRDYRAGKSVRWFSRVFHLALAEYRQDCVDQIGRLQKQSDEAHNNVVPPFRAQYILDALIDMGASFVTESGERDVMIVQGVAVDARIQALRDLSGPQVALLLLARRILARDGSREDSTAVPLTFDRMLEEYRSYRGNSNQYNHDMLWKSFKDLLDMRILCPILDHNGTGPLQYDHDTSNVPLDRNTRGRVPLHLIYDIHRELRQALEKNLLDCSTALREWGRKRN